MFSITKASRNKSQWLKNLTFPHSQNEKSNQTFLQRFTPTLSFSLCSLISLSFSLLLSPPQSNEKRVLENATVDRGRLFSRLGSRLACPSSPSTPSPPLPSPRWRRLLHPPRALCMRARGCLAPFILYSVCNPSLLSAMVQWHSFVERHHSGRIQDYRLPPPGLLQPPILRSSSAGINLPRFFSFEINRPPTSLLPWERSRIYSIYSYSLRNLSFQGFLNFYMYAVVGE